ncbi:MAG: GntR family transcriptional regulator [Lachnospiraceae bacterium]|nr:GntR family transcriptional regulator [Lachnospiraceae bacterium]
MSELLQGSLDYASPLTLQEQLTQMIREKIDSGALSPGKRLPTEEALCKQFDISRSTVRGAFRQLEEEGIIGRIRGKGTFVSESKIKRRMEKLYGFTQQMEALGKKPSSRVLKLEKHPMDGKMAAAFGMPVGSPLYQIGRLRFADGEPLLLESTYMPECFYPDLRAEQIAEQSLYELLRSEKQIQPYIAEEIYESILLDDKSCELLKCTPGSSGFRIERITQDAGGRVFEITRSYMSGSKGRISITLRGDNWNLIKKI